MVGGVALAEEGRKKEGRKEGPTDDRLSHFANTEATTTDGVEERVRRKEGAAVSSVCLSRFPLGREIAVPKIKWQRYASLAIQPYKLSHLSMCSRADTDRGRTRNDHDPDMRPCGDNIISYALKHRGPVRARCAVRRTDKHRLPRAGRAQADVK